MGTAETVLVIALVGAVGVGAAYFMGALCDPFKLCPPGGGGAPDVGQAYKDIISSLPRPGPRKLTGTENLCGVMSAVSFNCRQDKCGYSQWESLGAGGKPASGPRIKGSCEAARSEFLRKYGGGGLARNAVLAGLTGGPFRTSAAYSYPTIKGEHPMAYWQDDWTDRMMVT